MINFTIKLEGVSRMGAQRNETLWGWIYLP